MFPCETCYALGREHQNTFEQYKLGAMKFSAAQLQQSEHQQVTRAIYEARLACDASIEDLLAHLRGHGSISMIPGAAGDPTSVG